MTQNQIDQAVSIATGESLCDVRRIGFSIADPNETNFDPEPDDRPPMVVDWDAVDFNRHVSLSQTRQLETQLFLV